MGATVPLSSSRVKLEGVHYTPEPLSNFVAARLVKHANLDTGRPVRVLDPASGDGSLLIAVAQELRRSGYEVDLHAHDIDHVAVSRAQERLQMEAPWASFTGRVADFTEVAFEQLERDGELDLGLGSAAERFDLVVANPPYVRAQHLGAKRSQELARRFGITGRVDLYQAFIASLQSVLAPGASFGLIVPNRFLVTLGGHSTRRILAEEYELTEIFDLGDTKVFSAAVLPALVFGRHGTSGTKEVRLTSIYSDSSGPKPETTASIFDALDAGKTGHVAVGDKNWKITSGTVSFESGSDYASPWVGTHDDIRFLELVDSHTLSRFKSLGTIRVGVKTTADKVFIRRDWNLGDAAHPEPQVIRPLISSDNIRRWGCEQSGLSMLYPYDMTKQKRTPLDLSKFPGALSYLESHRATLEGRKYVTEGGRLWWEIWVPQKPSAWAGPKIVFPDISVEGKFAIDRTGALVNGNCYWLAIEGIDEDLAFLAVAVANSSLATRYYDAKFGNKLYAGRRRFISQYVNEFPLPDPQSVAAQRAIAIARFLEAERDPDRVAELENEANSAVWSAFGIEEPTG